MTNGPEAVRDNYLFNTLIIISDCFDLSSIFLKKIYFFLEPYYR
ncbi:hypothetical protein K710_2211 [Streptococcus iniae SF1]|nr:hypothetical protein K710_2211 [Streptococcus iniae SF1]EKB53229.1 hypothetical protein A0G_1064 [Streptococcus iniae 9117]